MEIMLVALVVASSFMCGIFAERIRRARMVARR